jgi:hypothetical protein
MAVIEKRKMAKDMKTSKQGRKRHKRSQIIRSLGGVI